MLYPFYCQALKEFETIDVQLSDTEPFRVWDDWSLKEIKSESITSWIGSLPEIELHTGKMYVSSGTTCNLHIDRLHRHMILHRVVVPLSEDFVYEWFDKTEDGGYKLCHSIRPVPNTAYLFNNMVPHRFVQDQESPRGPRKAIYLDLVDKKLRSYMSLFVDNFSSVNHILGEVL